MNTREAEQAITAILREFEESNQALVDSVIITDVEVTTVTDERPRFLRRVMIAAKRSPGHDWDE